jgi:hypothetical protein
MQHLEQIALLALPSAETFLEFPMIAEQPRFELGDKQSNQITHQQTTATSLSKNIARKMNMQTESSRSSSSHQQQTAVIEQMTQDEEPVNLVSEELENPATQTPTRSRWYTTLQ